jgi:hypothetical protein
MLLKEIDPIWEDYQIFDAHAHIGSYYDIDSTMSDEELLTYMERYGVKRCAVSAVTKNIEGDNDLVMTATKKLPGKIIGLAHIDPSRANKAIEVSISPFLVSFT